MAWCPITPTRIAATALTLTVATTAAASAETITEFRIGISPGESATERMQANECLRVAAEGLLGVPVSLFSPADMAGVIEGLIGGNLDMAYLGPSAYARVYLTNPEAVEPVLVRVNTDRSFGFYAIAFSRVDSGINSFEDAEGSSLAFGDPNSTSGFLIPDFELRERGFSTAPGEYFRDVVFSGGHNQSIIGVYNGDYDVSFTFTDGMGNWEDGYNSGGLRRVVDSGVIDVTEMQEIWRSDYYVEGPVVLRRDLPERVKLDVTALLASLSFMDPDCTYNFLAGEVLGLKPINHEAYKNLIEMRRQGAN